MNRLEGRIAVSCVGFTKVVGTFMPFHWTKEPKTKPEPLTVRGTSGLNMAVEVGDIELRTGAGLLGGAGGGLCQRTDVPFPVASLIIAPHMAPFAGED